jgi:hypothetical protein
VRTRPDPNAAGDFSPTNPFAKTLGEHHKESLQARSARNTWCFRRCDTSEMEVGLFPNPYRPGIGLRPRREGQRPLLPQHARHCPVLEAGSSAGFLVYPPLAEKETFQVSYEGEGRYQLVYSVNTKGTKWDPVFTVTYLLPMGGIGATKREIKMHIQDTPQTREIAHWMPGMFTSQDDMGTPAGAVTLRGAWNFQTPQGWDTVYTPVFNMIERPFAPMLVIRVETDWHVFCVTQHADRAGDVCATGRDHLPRRHGRGDRRAAPNRSGVLRREGENED